MGRVAKLLLAVAVVIVVVVAVGLLTFGGSDDTTSSTEPSAPASPSTTPLSEVDTTSLTVLRQPFCDLVTDDAVSDALGAEPQDTTTYDDGDTVRLVRGTQDVSHEYGCMWRSGKTIARAWVFAPPVTADRARGLARDVRRSEGCDRLRDSPDYGTPTAAVVCGTGRGSEVSLRGLFGDAWLTCTLSDDSSVAQDALVARAEDYCSAVALSAATP